MWTAALFPVYTRVLVLDPSDNAYLWLRMIGPAMMPAAVAFALCAALPWRPARLSLWWAGLGMAGLSGGLGLLVLLFALAIIPFQHYPTGTVFMAHSAGFVILALSLYLLLRRLPRHVRQQDGA